LLVAWGADDKTIPPRHHHDLAERVPHAVTVEIADAGHYPHETAPKQLLSALQTFLAATQPFRYVEDRWVQLITQPHPVDAGTPAAQPPAAHSTSSEALVSLARATRRRLSAVDAGPTPPGFVDRGGDQQEHGQVRGPNLMSAPAVERPSV
jgi:hypothetical protein